MVITSINIHSLRVLNNKRLSPSAHSLVSLLILAFSNMLEKLKKKMCFPATEIEIDSNLFLFILSLTGSTRLNLLCCLWWFALLAVLGRWSRCWSCSLLLCGLFCGAVCCMSFRVSFCSCVFRSFWCCDCLAWGRRLILVLFVRLFVLCLFGFVGFLFLFGSGKGCGL